MKHLILFLFIITHTFAEKSHLEDAGIILGFGNGYVSGNSSLNKDYIPVPAQHDSSDVGGKGALGKVILGFQGFFNDTFFMRFEALGYTSGLRGKNISSPAQAVSFKTIYKHKYSYGLMLYLGGKAYRINAVKKNFDTLLYFKLGVLRSYWSIESTSTISPASHSKSKWVEGAEAGIGIDFPQTTRFTFGLEFSHFEHRRFRTTHTNTYNISLRPRGDVLSVQIRYRF